MPLWRLSSSCYLKELLADTCLGASSVQEHTPKHPHTQTHTQNHNLL